MIGEKAPRWKDAKIKRTPINKIVVFDVIHLKIFRKYRKNTGKHRKTLEKFEFDSAARHNVDRVSQTDRVVRQR